MEIKDKIDFSVKAKDGELKVKIKYEQEREQASADEPDEADEPEDEDEYFADEKEEDEDEIDTGVEPSNLDDRRKRRSLTARRSSNVNQQGRRRRAQNVEETEVETSYEVMFDTIVEYAGDDAFDFGSSEIVQSIALSSWQPFSAVETDGMASTFSATTMDGIVSMQFHVSQADQGEAISANAMKIDVRVVDFPWERDDTYLALMSSIETEQETEVEYDDGTKEAQDVMIAFDSVDTADYIPFGEYTWANTAEADGNATISVLATSQTSDDGKSERMAFSFVGSEARMAADIYWDPEAGVGYAEGSAAAGLVALSMGSIALAVAGFFL